MRSVEECHVPDFLGPIRCVVDISGRRLSGKSYFVRWGKSQMECLYSNQDQWDQWDQPFRYRYLCLASFRGHLREQMNASLRYLALTQDLILDLYGSLMLLFWQQTWAEAAE